MSIKELRVKYTILNETKQDVLHLHIRNTNTQTTTLSKPSNESGV